MTKITIQLAEEIWDLIKSHANKLGVNSNNLIEEILKKKLEEWALKCSICNNPIINEHIIRCAECGHPICCGYYEITPPVYSNEYRCYECIGLSLEDDEEYDLEDLEWEFLNDLSVKHNCRFDIIDRVPPKGKNIVIRKE